MEKEFKDKLHTGFFKFANKNIMLIAVAWFALLYGFIKLPWTMFDEKSFKIFLLKAVVINGILIFFFWILYRCFRKFKEQTCMNRPDEKENSETEAPLEEKSSKKPKKGLRDMMLEGARTDDMFRMTLASIIYIFCFIFLMIVWMIITKAIFG